MSSWRQHARAYTSVGGGCVARSHARNNAVPTLPLASVITTRCFMSASISGYPIGEALETVPVCRQDMVY
jgi:hypothetical protein